MKRQVVRLSGSVNFRVTLPDPSVTNWGKKKAVSCKFSRSWTG